MKIKCFNREHNFVNRQFLTSCKVNNFGIQLIFRSPADNYFSN